MKSFFSSYFKHKRRGSIRQKVGHVLYNGDNTRLLGHLPPPLFGHYSHRRLLLPLNSSGLHPTNPQAYTPTSGLHSTSLHTNPPTSSLHSTGSQANPSTSGLHYTGSQTHPSTTGLHTTHIQANPPTTGLHSTHIQTQTHPPTSSLQAYTLSSGLH